MEIYGNTVNFPRILKISKKHRKHLKTVLKVKEQIFLAVSDIQVDVFGNKQESRDLYRNLLIYTVHPLAQTRHFTVFKRILRDGWHDGAGQF